MENEIWRDIPEYEGLYQVSNLGRVKSLPRQAKAKSDSFRIVKEKILTPIKSSNNYLFVNLYKNDSVKNWMVHTLVAISFLNHVPDGYNTVIDHINNNKEDNRLENLQLTNAIYNSSKNRTGSSKHTGVSWYKSGKKWRAQIIINKKKIHIGYFKSEEDAHLAYKNYLKNIDNE